MTTVSINKKCNSIQQITSYILLASGFDGYQIESDEKNCAKCFFQNIIMATVSINMKCNYIQQTLCYILLATGFAGY